MHCHAAITPKLSQPALLQNLQAMRHFMATKPEAFEAVSHASGLLENAALLLLVQARVYDEKGRVQHEKVITHH